MSAQMAEVAVTHEEDAAAVAMDLAPLRAAVSDLVQSAEANAPSLALSVAARQVEVRAREIADRMGARSEMTTPARRILFEVPRTTVPDRVRVLVVDDDVDQLALLERQLGRFCDVQTAQDLQSAATFLEEDAPDVVLTDLQLSSSSGLELIELLHASGEWSAIPVVILSGHTDTASKVRAFECGAFDYVAKPHDDAELAARIRNAAAHSHVVRRERFLGGRDDLTGLCNRRTFRGFLEGALRSARAANAPLSVILVDQDRLKPINDSWGHSAGDEALRTIAASLASSIRGSDCAARIGGDEFGLVIPGCGREGAHRLTTRFEETLARRPVTVAPGAKILVEASVGVACLGEAGPDESADALVARADRALYAHKRRHVQESGTPR